MQKKNIYIKENVSCDSSGIHLLSIFETLGQKLEVLLSTFRSTKRNLEWIYPPLCLTHPLILNFFKPPLPPTPHPTPHHKEIGWSETSCKRVD